MFSPRQAAAVTTATIVFKAQPVPSEATWDTIVADFSSLGLLASRTPAQPAVLQPTWTDTRESFQLTAHQAFATSVSKLLLWHWSQPVAYIFVFAIYYCDLDEVQQFYGKVVVARECMYLVGTVVALLCCPVFLLVELPRVWEPEVDGTLDGNSGSLSRRGWSSVSTSALSSWVMYLLAPHAFVQLCIIRQAESSGTNSLILNLLDVIWAAEIFADFCSMCALGLLFADPDPPVAMIIGYYMTTLSFATVMAGFAISIPRGLCRRGSMCSCAGSGKCGNGILDGINAIFTVLCGCVAAAAAALAGLLLVLGPMQTASWGRTPALVEVVRSLSAGAGKFITDVMETAPGVIGSMLIAMFLTAIVISCFLLDQCCIPVIRVMRGRGVRR
jgi:hypothetical protein